MKRTVRFCDNSFHVKRLQRLPILHGVQKVASSNLAAPSSKPLSMRELRTRPNSIDRFAIVRYFI